MKGKRLFALIGWDGPQGLELRQEHRPAHLANLEPLDAAGQIVHGGPLLDKHGSPIGSIIIFFAEDLGAARTWAANDPYVTTGIFERYEVHETQTVFPARGR